MRNKYYFISDVHLGIKSGRELNKLREQVLIKFIDEIQLSAAELYIVGDLFDNWIEYKEVVPKGYYKFFTKVSEAIENGLKIYYFAGNHDFWRGKYFKEEFGIDIIHTYLEKEIDGKKFFICHGDGFAYKDTGYKILKQILRSKVSQKLYSFLHPDFGIRLARHTSHSSRKYTSHKNYSSKDGLRDFAIDKLKEGYDYIVMGHRHKPIMEKSEESFYINLGDWIGNFSYGLFESGKFSLNKYYDIETREFVNKEIEF